MKKQIKPALFLLAGFISNASYAGIYTTQADNQVVGEPKSITVSYADSMKELARNYDIALEGLKQANPGKDMYVPGDGVSVTLPSQYIIPTGCKDNIVINQAEMRLYYCSNGGSTIATYPIGIGDSMTPSPLAHTKVVGKVEDPTWVVPKNILAEHVAKGDPIPAVVPPGPNNPLGAYALKLALQGYEIHGTNTPDGIGIRVSHGCIRLYPEDIKTLFSMVPIGTPVAFVYDPYKAGWSNGKLYFEAHRPFRDFESVKPSGIATAKQVIMDKLQGRNVAVNWALVERMVEQHTGVPQVISTEGSESYSQNEAPVNSVD